MLLVLLVIALLPLPGVLPSANGLTPHDIIRITGDSQFTGANGVVGGSGSSIDPFIIEGWDIAIPPLCTAPIRSDCSGIVIRFTTAHFVVRNVAVHDGNLTSCPPLSPCPDVNGINLVQVSNGSIEDSEITNNDFGIAILSSSSVRVTRVNATGNREYGIYVSGGTNNTIEDNDISDNEDGISISSSTGNLVEGNRATGSSPRMRNGIWLGAGATANTVRLNRIANYNFSLLINGLANGNLIQQNNFTYGPSYAGSLSYGMNIVGSRDNIIEYNRVNNTDFGIILTRSNRTMIRGNIAGGNSYGIGLEVGNAENTVTGNISSENDYGIYLFNNLLPGNLVYNNVFRGRFSDAFDGNSTNFWNTTLTLGPNIVGGPLIGGNYYASFGGANADCDGIGNTPYNLQGSLVPSKDFLPLVQTLGVCDLAVTNITTSSTLVSEGEAVLITVEVKNEGSFSESFTVATYYNDTAIGSQSVSNLAPGASQTLTFSWNTLGVDSGAYNVKAVASTIMGETDTSDNTGSVALCLLFQGDVNNDGAVNFIDLGIIGASFLKATGDPGFDPEADVNGDGAVNFLDLGIVGSQFLSAC
jgi:parallel beta-helix repeat protein